MLNASRSARCMHKLIMNGSDICLINLAMHNAVQDLSGEGTRLKETEQNMHLVCCLSPSVFGFEWCSS